MKKVNSTQINQLSYKLKLDEKINPDLYIQVVGTRLSNVENIKQITSYLVQTCES